MLHPSHRTPISAKWPSAGNHTKAAAALSCFGSDAHMSKHVFLQPFFPHQGSFFGEEFTSSLSSLMQLRVFLYAMLMSNHALSHAVPLAAEKLWISQVNYTSGTTASMLNKLTFHLIGCPLCSCVLRDGKQKWRSEWKNKSLHLLSPRLLSQTLSPRLHNGISRCDTFWGIIPGNSAKNPDGVSAIQQGIGPAHWLAVQAGSP